MFRSVVIAVFGIVLTATPGLAAGNDAGPLLATAAAAAPVVEAAESSLPAIEFPSSPSRGALLPSLYASLAALNAFDAYSTSKAIAGGAGTESNPLMRGVASHSAALWAVKGGVTAASILLAERMWRRHNRVGAIVTLIAVNSLAVATAANNAKVLRSR